MKGWIPTDTALYLDSDVVRIMKLCLNPIGMIIIAILCGVKLSEEEAGRKKEGTGGNERMRRPRSYH